MGKNLVVVESPAKAKTIKKYLGEDFEVLASYGHVRDLLPKEGAVDPEKDFHMTYQTIEKNQKHFDAILKAMKKSDALYLATDPDREGEAISWHLQELLIAKKALKGKPIKRIIFHEITKKAVQEAVANPRDLSLDLINAQQARRALDYLVGFNLSPLLWKKIRRGLSAGRVQSPALRMIAEREDEIEKFTTQEYWSIEANLSAESQEFAAKLTYFKGKKLQQFSITDQTQAHDIEQQLSQAAAGKLTVTEVEKKSRKRNPSAPFITSTLQQEAVRKLRFSAKKTMQTAQQLYEGVAIADEGEVGLITYMRTDSVHLAAEAIENIRDHIAKNFGADFSPKQPRVFKTKAKNAQEAHEAIRPTSIDRTPTHLKKYLSADQFKLYELIWKRTLASQMIHATIDTVSADFTFDTHNFRANGSTIANPGFLRVYEEGLDDKKDDGDSKRLPPLTKGDVVDLLQIRTEQHFTEPPPRYGEASLVKSLEEHGIGRPSTYATIISTLQNREYVELNNRRFFPTDVGRIVNKFLTNHFTQYIDYDFTAKLEDELDAVSRGEKEWIPLMRKFWTPFKQLVDDKEKTVDRKDVTQEIIEEKCPTCNEQLSIRLGKRGRFIGCTAYPDCDYTRSLDQDKETAQEPEVVEGRVCPKCEATLIIRQGRYGKFIGCSTFPECKHIEPLEKPEDTHIECPDCQKGTIFKRKSRNGKIFFSCGRYPDCKYAIWNEPVNEACPSCNWPILSMKTTKKRGTEKVCPQKSCKFSEPVETAAKD